MAHLKTFICFHFPHNVFCAINVNNWRNWEIFALSYQSKPITILPRKEKYTACHTPVFYRSAGLVAFLVALLDWSDFFLVFKMFERKARWELLSVPCYCSAITPLIMFFFTSSSVPVLLHFQWIFCCQSLITTLLALLAALAL